MLCNMHLLPEETTPTTATNLDISSVRVTHWAMILILITNIFISVPPSICCFHFISVAFNPNNCDTWCCITPPQSTMSKEIRQKMEENWKLFWQHHFCNWLKIITIFLRVYHHLIEEFLDSGLKTYQIFEFLRDLMLVVRSDRDWQSPNVWSSFSEILSKLLRLLCHHHVRAKKKRDI